MLALLLAGCASGHAAAGSHPPASPAPSHPRDLSARVVLAADSMTTGSSMTGHLLLDNSTGHAIHVPGCHSLFQVALTSSTYRPTVAWSTCLQRLTIPAGHTSYRILLRASYSQCGRGPQHNGLKECLPGGRMPPLSPGIYHARLFQARTLVRIPPALCRC